MIDCPLCNGEFLREIPLGEFLAGEPVDDQLPFSGVGGHAPNIGHLHKLVNSLPIVNYKIDVETLGKLLLMVVERRNTITRPFVSKVERDAGLLRDKWDRVNKDRVSKGLPRLSRKELAQTHKVTPGMISHYMRGREPLNVKWQMRFADYLGMSPSAIWEDFPHKNLAPGQIPPEAVELALDVLGLDPGAVDAVRSLIAELTKKRA